MEVMLKTKTSWKRMVRASTVLNAKHQSHDVLSSDTCDMKESTSSIPTQVFAKVGCTHKCNQWGCSFLSL